MQKTCPASESLTLENSASPSLTPNQRGIVLAMLLGVHLFAATLCPSNLGSTWIQWDFVWVGCWLVPLFLAACWGGLSIRPIALRIPEGFFLTAIIGLAMEWGSNQSSPVRSSPLLAIALMVLILLVIILPLLLFRKFRGWRICLAGETAVAEQPRLQFSLRQMLLWTTGLAILFGLARSIAPDQMQKAEPLEYEEVLSISVMLGMLLLFFLPIFISSMGSILSENRRRRFAIGTIVLIPLSAFLFFATFLALTYFMNGPSGMNFLEEAAEVAIVSASLILSFIITAFGTLITLRYCGYRLVRIPKKSALPAPASSNPFAKDDTPTPQQTTPARRSTFPYLLATIALIGLFLCWPAYEIHLANRQYAADRAIENEWTEVGANNVLIQYGKITNMNFSNTPVKDAALEKLQKLGKEEHIGNLVFTSASLTTDQLKRLGKAKSFDSLQISSIPLQDDGLFHLQNLTHMSNLDISNTDITDVGLEHLQTLKQLRSLNLTGTKVTNKGIDKLQDTLPNCAIIGRSRPLAIPPPARSASPSPQF